MKFIVDTNVGKLAKPLRALGYDTAFINPIDDSELVEIAHRERRILLTKDTGIMRRRTITTGAVRAIQVRSDHWREQLAQVVEELRLTAASQFTRCMECNVPLLARTRDEARPHVPPYVYWTQTAIQSCPVCARHYWQGTHWRRMNDEFASIVPSDS